MFQAEAIWLEVLMRQWQPERLSPLLNVGSGTGSYRRIAQPWSESCLFAPLKERGVRLVHLDAREGDGIDVQADILAEADRPKIMNVGAKAILCCSVLEHVRDPKAFARCCIDIVGPGGLIFVTVPHSYPYHRDPIDTMYRPTPAELAALFGPAVMLKGEIFDARESYRGQVRRRPWLLLRHLLRLPFPFIGFEGWKRSMSKLYWLAHNYHMTAAAFEVPLGVGMPRLAPIVDREEHGI